MSTLTQLSNQYISFNGVDEFEAILGLYETLNFNYKFWSNDIAMNRVMDSSVNKVTFKDGFVLTSKEKVNTITLNQLKQFIDSEPMIKVSNLNTPNQSVPTMRNPKAILNEIRSAKLFKDEEYLEWLATAVDDTLSLAENFQATLAKASEKANKLHELAEMLAIHIENREVSEIETTVALIESSKKYITKTNKVLAAISSTGEFIIKAEKKDDKVCGAKFIWE